MNINIEYTDRKRVTHKKVVRGSYLVGFVKANKKYHVSYTIDNHGKRINTPALLLGKDLTEPQIIDLFIRECL